MVEFLKALNLTGNLLAGLEDSSSSGFEALSNNSSAAASGSTVLANATSSAEKIQLDGFDLPGNYSILINKLEQLALGLDSALGNFTIDRQEVEINLSGGASANDVADVADDLLFSDVIPAARAPPSHIAHGSRIFTGEDEDFTHVVSDIWIGVILTLLIVFVIFFICACFLYHKFTQWKNSCECQTGRILDKLSALRIRSVGWRKRGNYGVVMRDNMPAITTHIFGKYLSIGTYR